MITTLSIIATLSLVFNFTLVWYVRKLLLTQEEISSELYEEILVFQEYLEAVLNTDVMAGEPTLIKLLDDVRNFAESTERIRMRLVPTIDEIRNIGEETNV